MFLVAKKKKSLSWFAVPGVQKLNHSYSSVPSNLKLIPEMVDIPLGSLAMCSEMSHLELLSIMWQKLEVCLRYLFSQLPSHLSHTSNHPSPGSFSSLLKRNRGFFPPKRRRLYLIQVVQNPGKRNTGQG